MTSEAGLRVCVRRHLAPRGHFVRLEDNPTAGVPDLHYTLARASGFLELKHLRDWPKRLRTPVRVASLRPAQVAWLEREALMGGRAWVLLQVGDEWLLLTPDVVRSVFEGSETKDTLIARATVHGKRKFPALEILRALRGPPCTTMT
jgi:hypothetical protein